MRRKQKQEENREAYILKRKRQIIILCRNMISTPLRTPNNEWKTSKTKNRILKGGSYKTQMESCKSTKTKYSL